ncbi:btk-binding protein-related [Anaeramoeba flamelloides]|uniref:Btk-binding protein-related n=1 Tax=Anaeramoeba flamelloides TaxID=1746091 RepID=A0ABQ8Y319_9EUKA|nr:btk-binding protein-related [Anaeramoeba flamelloides]
MNYLAVGSEIRGTSKTETKKLVELDVMNDLMIKKIVSNNHSTLFLAEDGSLYEVLKNNKKERIKHDLENVVDISSGNYHFLVKTENKVYSFGFTSGGEFYGQLGQGNDTPLDKPKEIQFFQDKKVTQIGGSGWTSYFVCENGDLYCCGWNGGGNYGNGNTANVSTPLKSLSNIKRVFARNFSQHVIMERKTGEIIVTGYNCYGQLGTGNTTNVNTPVTPAFLKGKKMEEDIRDIFIADHCSFILMTNGELYISGTHFGGGSKTFTKMMVFKDKPVKTIGSGYSYVYIGTEGGDLYILDKQSSGGLKKVEGPYTLYKYPFTIEDEFSELSCSRNIRNCYIKLYSSGIAKDMKTFFENKKFTNGELNKIPVHKLILEYRTGLKFEEIHEISKTWTNELSQDFCLWCYSGILAKNQLLVEQLKSMGIQTPKKKLLNDDLLKLYKDEDSKDFNILVKTDEDEEDYDDEEDLFEEIPVHKEILLARSGLFRDLFENVNQESNSVKDFSGKTIESIEILVRYFYTNKIEITADDDPQLIVEELSDALEYYQLVNSTNLKNELTKIKKQFNLK